MKITRKSFLSLFIVIVFSFAKNVFSQTNISLQNQRTDIIKQYVKLLSDGNYQSIPYLFTTNASAVSSSGIPDNPIHFYKTLFTKTITQPQATLINIFNGTPDQNMMAAYFNYSWKNSEGKKVSAKFLDLFIFEANSTKIKWLFVYSNTFQEDIMKQLR